MASFGKIARHAVTVGLSLAVMCGSAVPAFAIPLTAPENGTPEGYTYNETGTMPAEIDETGEGEAVVKETHLQFGTLDAGEDEATSGSEGVHVSYSTVGGTWVDSGPDMNTDKDNVIYPSGTFQVTVPKEIKFENMRVGSFDVSDTYDIWVRGAIPENKCVRVSNSGVYTFTDSGDTNPSDSGSEVMAYVTWKRTATVGGSEQEVEGKYWDKKGGPVFTAHEVYGTSTGTKAVDGGALGSICHDTVKLTGFTSSVGTWDGYITYTANLVEPPTA